MRRLMRLSVPAALLGIGLWLLSGCLPIPAFEAPTGGTNAAEKVGDEKSKKPLRIDRATRSDVLRVLGPPYIESKDGRTVAYTWSVLNAVTIWPLCFYAHDVDGARTMVLRFDGDGVLRSTQVLKADEPLAQLSAHMLRIPLPPELREELRARERALTPLPWPLNNATPSTAPTRPE